MESKRFRTVWRSLFPAFRRHAASREDAEDALQEAFLRLSMAQREADILNEEAFLARAGRNVMIDGARRRRVRAETHADAAVASLLRLQEPLPDEAAIAREQLACATRLIAAMPDRARTVFLLHRVDGCSYRDIAARLEISTSAVEKNMARALLFMAVHWEDGA